MKKGYSEKSNDLEFEVKDNGGQRIVKGYFAAFDNVDAHNDVFVKGAFAKSIAERGVNSTGNRKIAHLAFHDLSRPVGNLKVLEEHTKGLYFESELGTHTDGEDAFRMYKEGIIKEHSVGFQYMGDKVEYNEDTDVYTLKEVKLFEGSFVTFGANSETPVVKSEEEKAKLMEELAEQREALLKMVTKGGDLIELELRKLIFKYEALGRFNPPKATAVKTKSEPQKKDEALINYYKNLLK